MMTKYYTVDRRMRLSVGQILGLSPVDLQSIPDLEAHYKHLFPNGVSDHGHRYLPHRANERDPSIELLWEFVRRAAFPHRPSRLTSVFAWQSLDDARRFKRENHLTDARIYELKGGNPFVANMSLLNNSTPLLRTSQMAHAYWEGGVGPTTVGLADPRWEVLLSAPVIVGAEVS
ncbi:DUF2441 domain-containing protein [Paraburkholderia bannensis]|uniref:DUF2441 domain-containing protein n=1 Tax=Paraburkholderia bannensis TaxID=765414 RepID=UPI002ABD29E3|nr:DUF2441 domain-containing protein [Paraburkholderia bannensis]